MNRKRIATIFFVALLALNLVACGGNPIKNDISSYINDSLPALMDLDTIVSDGYASVSGDNYTDDKTMYDVIKDQVMPVSSELIGMAEAIVPKTEEVRTIHEEYISAINTQHSAFGLILSALEAQDYSIVSLANEKMSEARAFMREYIADLYEIAAEYDIEISMDGFKTPESIYDGEDIGSSDPASMEIPESLLFTFDGMAYTEPNLGDFDAFVNTVFASYEEQYSEVDGTHMKLFGPGNEGYGYAMNIILHLDPMSANEESSDILSMEVTSLVVSADPNSGGEEISGQEMIQWVYENF